MTVRAHAVGFIKATYIPGAHPNEGGAAGLQPPQTPQIRNFKNTDFVYITISIVLRDLPFSRNQPLKSADD
jgi:hypothetical protein